jgi:putative transposase
MDERHTIAAVRYVEQNPVRAGLVSRAWDWPWSSAKPHVFGRDDGLVSVRPMLEKIGDWTEFLKAPASDIGPLRKHLATGRPLGDALFTERCEKITGQDLKLRKAGRPRRDDTTSAR